MLVKVLRTAYVTDASGSPGLTGMIPAPLDFIQRIAFSGFCQIGLDHRNRVDVSDDVITLLAEFQADPDRVPAGIMMLVGEAVTAYTNEAPAATLAKFQQAMLDAMGDD